MCVSLDVFALNGSQAGKRCNVSLPCLLKTKNITPGFLLSAPAKST